jgi:hypothetical protein
MGPQGGIGEVVQIHDILNDARRLIKPRQSIDGNLNGKVKIIGMKMIIMSADEGGGLMKRAAVILMMMFMISLWQQAVALDESDPIGSPITDESSYSPCSSEIKKMEERMATALAALPNHAGSQVGGDLGRSPEAIEPGANSSENSTINSSLPQNGSLNNISQSGKGDASLSGQKAVAKTGIQDPLSFPSSRFQGTYASRASRHEVGKGGVDSSISLNGKFEMDKSVMFQDRGF